MAELDGLIEKLATKFDEGTNGVRQLVERQQVELKQFGEVTRETAGALEKATTDLRDLQTELKEIRAKFGAFTRESERLNAQSEDESRDVGEEFVKSEAYKAMLSRNGATSDSVKIGSFYRKALTSDTGSAGDLVRPYRRPGLVIAPDRPLRIRDLMNVQRLTSNAVEYVREIGYANVKTVLTAGSANNVATVTVQNAEGFYAGQKVQLAGTINRTILSVNYATNVITLTANVGGSGVITGDTLTSIFGFDAGTIAATPETLVKPEMAVAYDLQTEAVKTIAHWIPASRQIMADASVLAGRINDRLVYGLKFSEEHHILYGDGSSRQLQGILTDAARQTYNWSSGTVGDTKVDAIRRAITKSMLAYYPVTGVVLHPVDWEDIELLKGTDKHYIWVTVPDGAGVMRVWSIPVVVTTAINQGEFALGAWNLGATLYDREDATVRIAEQHEDFFIRNMVLVLGEERLVQTVERPESFVHGYFNSAPV
jgi:HK97 family phage major capsid protein